MKRLSLIVIMMLLVVGCSTTGVGDTQDNRVAVVETNMFEINLSGNAKATIITDNSGTILDCSRTEDNNTVTNCSIEDKVEVAQALDNTVGNII